MGKDLKGKELGSGIYQRKDGRYEGKYVDRFGKRRSCYSNTVSGVKRQINEKIYEDKHELSVVEDGIKLDDWYKRWMKVYKEESVRSNTLQRYDQLYKKHISPELGNLAINDISHFNVQLFINNLKQKNLGWETQNATRILLVDLFNRAMIDNYCRSNPAKGIRLPSNKPQHATKFLTTEEQTTFFNTCSGTWYDNLFNVAINTGLRPGELFALSWGDIDLEKRLIHVRHTLVYQQYLNDTKKTFHLEPPKTQSGLRDVPINDICLKHLQKQHIQKTIIANKKGSNEEFSDRLFVTRNNTPLNSQIYADAIHSIISEINLMRDELEEIEAFSGHTFRHTFASRCIEAGVNPKVLQEILGHATLQMTMDLYVHNSDETKEKALKRIEEEFAKLEINTNVL